MSAPKVNLAEGTRCGSGPTTGCWERGDEFNIRRVTDGVVLEVRVLCRYHSAMLGGAYGPVWFMEHGKESTVNV